MNTNKKGFTLIELLVVIVIIGILATISVATFGGYFKKARDAERQSVVQNVATIMKVINATEETTDYSAADITALNGILAAQGYSASAGKNGYEYAYAYHTANEDEFFIASCSEETLASGFVAGTPAAVALANTAIDTTGDCDAAEGEISTAITDYTLFNF